MIIEKFENGTCDRIVLYEGARDVVVTIGKNEYRISESFGGLNIQKSNDRVKIEPNVSNDITIY